MSGNGYIGVAPSDSPLDPTQLPVGMRADQTTQEAASSNTVFVTPGVQKYHPSAAKAWVLFNGTGTVAITGSYNVSSITDTNVGNYTVNFTTAFSGATYAMVGAVSQTTGGATAIGIVGHNQDLVTFTGSAVAIYVMNPSTTALTDYPKVSLAFFGDQ